MPNQSPDPSLLLPRRQAILKLIQTHPLISFDSIHRRFFTTPSRTLHYDLQYLLKQGFIKKLGVTRGALYAPLDFKLAST